MVNQSKRVGVLGGSFNPVHLGHLHIAKELKLRCRLDEVWFVPAYQNPHKMDLPIVSAVHRLEMLRLATRDYPFYKVLDIECMRKGASYTVDTLRYLHEEYPENTYFLLLGTDTIKRFHEWKEPYEILELCTLIVASRGQQDISVNFPDEQLEQAVESSFVSIPLLEVSSTKIRSLIEQGRSFKHLVPYSVYQYIKKHTLYQHD